MLQSPITCQQSSLIKRHSNCTVSFSGSVDIYLIPRLENEQIEGLFYDAADELNEFRNEVCMKPLGIVWEEEELEYEWVEKRQDDNRTCIISHHHSVVSSAIGKYLDSRHLPMPSVRSRPIKLSRLGGASCHLVFYGVEVRNTAIY